MPPVDENYSLGLIERQVEALLFVSPQPVSAETIAAHLGISAERAEAAIKTLRAQYAKGRGITLLHLGGGWQMATAPDLADTVESFAAFLSTQRIRLSRAALETLSVIAYNQPITMSEIEEIRSVRCDRVVETLLKNGLIDRPRSDSRKKSMRRYRTTNKFLEIFGLSSISALPTLEELRGEYEEDGTDEPEPENGAPENERRRRRTAMSEGTIRLNRYLAMCGAGARRKVEEFITAGRVRINGETVTEPGRQVAPGDVVELDGRELSPVEPTYLIFNKPKGVLSAVEDSRERTVIDILPPSMDRLRLFPVGRLDRDSEGLIILTNDGMFSQELIHPRNGFTKTYEVELRRSMDEPTLIRWTKGVDAEGVFLKPLSVRRLARNPMQCWFEVVLGEGIKREIRLMARALGNDVRRLLRRKIGKLTLKTLPAGEFISVDRETLWRYIKEGKTV